MTEGGQLEGSSILGKPRYRGMAQNTHLQSIFVWGYNSHISYLVSFGPTRLEGGSYNVRLAMWGGKVEFPASLNIPFCSHKNLHAWATSKNASKWSQAGGKYFSAYYWC